jgi:hypothetical protein
VAAPNKQNPKLEKRDLKALERLTWLADVPHFIDEDRVRRFFDAVVRPEYEQGKTTREVGADSVKKVKAALGIDVGFKAKIPAFLSFFLGDVEGNAKGSAGAEGALETANKTAVKVEFSEINSAERKLEELAVYYLLHHRDRIVFNEGRMEGDNTTPWYQAPFTLLQSVPRSVGFLDLAPEIKLIPTAAEFANGEIVLLYDLLLKELTNEEGGPIAKYPDEVGVAENTLRAERKKYWASYEKRFKPRIAMTVVETAAASRGRINWIDFRLPFGVAGDTIHLHFAPNGRYDTGDFGYYLVMRGYKHGLRVVGTLKSEPDMNVLAVYEK